MALDDVAHAARRILDSVRARPGPSHEERAAEAQAFYGRVVGSELVADGPAEVVGDVWLGTSLWAVLDPDRFRALATRMDDLVRDAHGFELRLVSDRWGVDAVARVLTDEIARRRDVWVESEEDRAIVRAKMEADADDEDDEDDEDDDWPDDDEDDWEDDSAWGVETEHDQLVDDLDDYLDDDRVGGSEFFEAENYSAIGYKGEVPATARALIELRGHADWVRFYAVPYGGSELLEVAEAVMDALDGVGVQCVSGGPDDGCTGALVRHHSDGPATTARAQAAAAEVARRTGIPVRTEVTDEPLAVALVDFGPRPAYPGPED